MLYLLAKVEGSSRLTPLSPATTRPPGTSATAAKPRPADDHWTWNVAPATRPHPLGEPAAADPTGLADPAFIQEPDLERHLRSQLAVAGDQRREGFF